MSEVILSMQQISKSFTGVKALDGVSLECYKGEVHALMGENGAGKSTLMKILVGAHQPDAGEIYLKGQRVQVTNPRHAQELGISIIYQELNLLPDLTVVENIFLGREPRNRFGVINTKEMEKRAHELLERLQVSIDLHSPMRQLKVAQQQMVEIAKTLSLNADIIVMDEPTAPLTTHEIEHLFSIIHSLRASGVTIIYISHRLNEIYQLADRITVLKDGQLVGTTTPAETREADLVKMMVGRSLDDSSMTRQHTGEVVLRVENLRRKGVLNDISFSLHCGEILGVAGLIGSGRTEMVRAIFGADKRDGGTIYLNGAPIDVNTPHDAVRYGIGLVPEDRKSDGLVLGLSIKHNASLPNLNQLKRLLGFVNHAKETETVTNRAADLEIKAAGLHQQVRFLSGGNQQKVILAKWLMRNPAVIILDEPTRGIDVGAKGEIYHLMHQLAAQGAAILMISSELPEILRMSDRVLVMREGTLVGELTRDEASEEQIMLLATGQAQATQPKALV